MPRITGRPNVPVTEPRGREIKESESSPSVRYETLQIPESAGGEHAGKYVYRHGDKYFFEGTGKEVPAELVGNLKRNPVETVVFRRPQGEEKPDSMPSRARTSKASGS